LLEATCPGNFEIDGATRQIVVDAPLDRDWGVSQPLSGRRDYQRPCAGPLAFRFRMFCDRAPETLRDQKLSARTVGFTSYSPDRTVRLEDVTTSTTCRREVSPENPHKPSRSGHPSPPRAMQRARRSPSLCQVVVLAFMTFLAAAFAFQLSLAAPSGPQLGAMGPVSKGPVLVPTDSPQSVQAAGRAYNMSSTRDGTASSTSSSFSVWRPPAEASVGRPPPPPPSRSPNVPTSEPA